MIYASLIGILNIYIYKYDDLRGSHKFKNKRNRIDGVDVIENSLYVICGTGESCLLLVINFFAGHLSEILHLRESKLI